MSVLLVASLARERRRLAAVEQVARVSEPPFVASLIRTAMLDLEEAEQHLRARLDRQAAG